MTYRMARRIVVLVVGTTVVLVGLAMLVLPGPGLVVIPLGLAILGIEFAWARAWLRRVREGISNQAAKMRSRQAESHRQDAESSSQKRAPKP